MKKLFSLIVPLVASCILLFAFYSCSDDYVPKPKGYFRIDLPTKSYVSYAGDCPFGFELPVYAQMRNSPSSEGDPCWQNMEFPQFNATLHLSYKEGNNHLAGWLEDSRNLAYKHAIKADAIDEELIFRERDRVYGIVYSISGDAASPLQFFLTDSLNRFFRGSLYFNVLPNKDSLNPVREFLVADINRMIQTFYWK